MRFFSVAIFFGLVVGLAGYATNNWSAPLIQNPNVESQFANSLDFSLEPVAPPLIRISEQEQLLTTTDVTLIR